ncbi:MAG TPA: flagellar filament capping protein FliD, partial [Terracidiphilus sp.]|nr:flagellar filament capping protein FliD [Terracidiphilus sp.]
MGTVGLSFGSPTSGTGFDVSATVSQIVANLQNVETPWKTQLTSLQGQDTVFSNLGTLLSSLSNDMSQLTDFTGILAQKTGSSSDTNVLQLTNATSAAVAGTHSVVVKNLATTSSGYLTALPSASAQLSGSITLEVGGGAQQTIQMSSLSNQTLSGLATAINSSGAGITASVLTDATGSRLSLVSGTSGANGAISVSANSLAAATNTAMNYTQATSSSGNLTGIPGAGDTLNGTLTLQVGTNPPQAINVDAADSDNTLTSLMNTINGNSSLGVTASIVTSSDGTESLSLSAQGGQALTVTPSLTDTSSPLAYTQTVVGTNAALTVDGVNLSSASNLVTNLIPGVTFQLLAPSATLSGGGLEQVQVIIGNDNSGVESAINQMVTDYNALASAIHTQEGKDASGNPEPLFGSPTLSLLQQQMYATLNQQNPNGYLTPLTVNATTALSGSITVQVGSGSPQTIDVPSGDTSLQGLANAINTANIGITAGISTQNGQSTLSLMSQTAGTAGALTVTSNVSATTQEALTWAGMPASGSSYSQGVLAQIPNGNDVLAGSITVQAGSGNPQTITLDSSDNTLQGLADAINNTSGIGVTATVTTNSDGSAYLSLQSQTPGSAGNLTITSNLFDTTNATTTDMAYSNSSDISTLANLGITVSQSDNGSLTFDASVLD